MDKLKAEGSADKLVQGVSDRAVIEIPGTQNKYTCVWVVYTTLTGDDTSHQTYLAHYVTAEGDYLHSMPVTAPGDADALSGQSAKNSFDFDAYEPGETNVSVQRADGTNEEITVPVLKDTATGKAYLGDAKRKILCADYATYAFDFAPVKEAAEKGVVSIGFYKAPDANPLMRVESWPVAGTTVAKMNLPAGDYYVVASVGNDDGSSMRRVMALGENGWTNIGSNHKDPEAIKAAGKVVTVEAGKPLEVLNDNFAQVANDALKELAQAAEAA